MALLLNLDLIMKWMLVFFLSFFTTWACLAQTSIQLYEWRPGPTLAPLILPVKSSETPEQAAKRYLQQLNRNTDLMELFEGQLPHLPIENFKRLTDENREQKALLIANLPKDYTRNSARIESFKKIFSQARHTSYILPINANLGLTLNETQELFKLIADNFPLMVAMGGDDVDPSLYKQQNIHAQRTILARDRFEIALIKAYTSQEKGFLLGVCRGAQISSVALGYQLIQDVPTQVGENILHRNHWHSIHVHPTKYNILYSLTNGTGKLFVNSLHHQSVIYKADGALQMAAQGEDRVTEATEFKNGRGLLLQFHPELMYNQLGSQILWNVLKQKNTVTPLRCSKLFI